MSESYTIENKTLTKPKQHPLYTKHPPPPYIFRPPFYSFMCDIDKYMWCGTKRADTVTLIVP